MSSSLQNSRKIRSSTITTLTAGSKTQSIITPSVYIDPTTHIRIDMLNYTPSEIKCKLNSTKFIRLCEIYKQPAPMPSAWCTMAVLASKSDVKQASNGSTYSIWRITDFKKTINLFLFGNAHQSLWKTTLSSVLLIYDGDARKSGQLSIKYERNLSVLGINPDLGQCKAKVKSGEQCKMLVDRHSCEYCVTHAHQMHKSSQRYRSEFNVRNMSRMNLQSTGSFVPKKFATLSSKSSISSSVWPTDSFKSTLRQSDKSSKESGNRFSNREKAMLAMLGIEDDSLICVRTQEVKGDLNYSSHILDLSIFQFRFR